LKVVCRWIPLWLHQSWPSHSFLRYKLLLVSLYL
jgi:hypothetical protein